MSYDPVSAHAPDRRGSAVRIGLWCLGGLSVGFSMSTQLFQYILSNQWPGAPFEHTHLLTDIAEITATLDGWGSYAGGWQAHRVSGLLAFGLLLASPVLYATRRRSDLQIWFATGCVVVALAGAFLGFMFKGDCVSLGSGYIDDWPGCYRYPVPWRLLVVGGHLALLSGAVAWGGWKRTEGIDRTVPILFGSALLWLSVESIRQFFEDVP